jgi:protein O-GlcNAc transferase
VSNNLQLTDLFDEAASLFAAGALDSARTCYKQILAFDKCNARALHALGVLAYQQHIIEEALLYLTGVLEKYPDYLEAYTSLGKIQHGLGRLLAAKCSFSMALKIEPESVTVLCELACVCREMHAYEQSEEYLQKALQLNRSCSIVHYELGRLRLSQKQYDAAITCFLAAIELQPDYAEAYAQLEFVYTMQGNAAKAYAYLLRSLQQKPDSVVLHAIQAFTLHYVPGSLPEDIYSAAQKWSTALEKKSENNRQPTYHCNIPDPDRRLRIGFVSPDFRLHPVGYFVQSVLMLHDAQSYEFFCYSDVKGNDEITISLIESAEHWRSVYGVADEKLAEIIRRDQIDILVDLAGHTRGNRLNVFAMKPAPIQVTWAGYVGTTGLSTIDYLISDKWQSPEGSEEYTVEKIIRMPDDYICYTPPEFAPDVAPLPALQNGYITFGSFNNLAKMSEDAVSLWAEVLALIPGSKLFMKNPSFSDQSSRERYIQLFESHGITRDRLLFDGQGTPREMLEHYSRMDIQLDTMPYSGGLTTLESLWMGVPVVTLPGVLFSSRHSLTHLMNVGLPEYVASSREEYVAIACRLATDLTGLSTLRSNLRGMMSVSPVCDGFGFTENLQNAFRDIWCDWCKGYDSVVGESEYSEGTFLGDHIAYNDQGNRCSEAGETDTALSCYKAALDIKPGYVEAYFNMALVYKNTDNLDEAVRCLKLVICLSPDFLEAYEQLEQIIKTLGQEEEACAVLVNMNALKRDGIIKSCLHEEQSIGDTLQETLGLLA